MARTPKINSRSPKIEEEIQPSLSTSSSMSPREGSKQAAIVSRLHQPTGATLAELVQATGWLPHTTRAALTGLRKRGHAIVSDKSTGTMRYRIEVAA